jgi:hypothetical protein
MSCERDFFTLKGEKFTFSNNLWSKNPFAKVEKIPFAKESRSDDIGHWFPICGLANLDPSSILTNAGLDITDH